MPGHVLEAYIDNIEENMSEFEHTTCERPLEARNGLRALRAGDPCTILAVLLNSAT